MARLDAAHRPQDKAAEREPDADPFRQIPMRRIIVILALLTVTLLAACGSDDTTATTDSPGATPDPEADPDSAGSGTIAVHIEDVDGVFVEGFEVGLRFETADGDPIASTLWSDFVSSQGDPTLEDYYDSVLEQPVPSGDVIVLASANVGIGPGPEVPDLNGELRCRLPVVVPADGRVDVEVTFSDPEACLRLS